MPQKPALDRRCSFCHRTESGHGVKLISSPQDYGPVFICEACVAVCAAVLEDDLDAAEHDPPRPATPPAQPAPPESPLSHPMAAELLERVEQWVTRETSGRNATAELNQLRSAAKLMFINPDA